MNGQKFEKENTKGKKSAFNKELHLTGLGAN